MGMPFFDSVLHASHQDIFHFLLCFLLLFIYLFILVTIISLFIVGKDYNFYIYIDVDDVLKAYMFNFRTLFSDLF